MTIDTTNPQFRAACEAALQASLDHMAECGVTAVSPWSEYPSASEHTVRVIAAALEAWEAAKPSPWQPIETAPCSLEACEWEAPYDFPGAATVFPSDDEEPFLVLWQKVDFCIAKPTHWMPLPAPPKESDK
ncbi:MAG: DUF551 domain-containing protein [Bosea sp. (in: a-proteobacteria)]